MKEKQQKEQKFEDGWCSQCKMMTKFVTHADFPDRWLCINRGCYHWTRKLKNKPEKHYI